MTDDRRPRVSVCVPTYNYGAYIVDCIESVLAQTVTDWELVIGDDGSDDGTRTVCERYARQDARVRYVVNDARLGMYGNFARTVARATGVFVKPLCADDWLHPDYLETCLALAARYPSAALIATNCVDTDVSGRPLSSTYLLPKAFFSGAEMISREVQGQGGIGGNSSFFFRRVAYDTVGGYDPSFRYLADHLLGLRLCRVGDFAYSPRPLFYGRHHERQSSVTDPRLFLDLADWYRIPAAVFGPSSPRRADWWRARRIIGRVGANYALNAMWQIARGDRRWGRELLAAVFGLAPAWWPILVMAPGVWARRIVRTLWRSAPATPVDQLLVVKPTVGTKVSA